MEAIDQEKASLNFSLKEVIKFIPKEVNEDRKDGEKVIFHLKQLTFNTRELVYPSDGLFETQVKNVLENFVVDIENFDYKGKEITIHNYLEQLLYLKETDQKIMDLILEIVKKVVTEPDFDVFVERFWAAGTVKGLSKKEREGEVFWADYNTCFDLWQQYNMGNGLPLNKTWGDHPIWVIRAITKFNNEYEKVKNKKVRESTRRID